MPQFKVYGHKPRFNCRRLRLRVWAHAGGASKEVNTCVGPVCWGLGARRCITWQKAPDSLRGPRGGCTLGHLLGEGRGPTAPGTRLIFRDARGRAGAGRAEWGSGMRDEALEARGGCGLGGLGLGAAVGAGCAPLPEQRHSERVSIGSSPSRPLRSCKASGPSVCTPGQGRRLQAAPPDSPRPRRDSGCGPRVMGVWECPGRGWSG